MQDSSSEADFSSFISHADYLQGVKRARKDCEPECNDGEKYHNTHDREHKRYNQTAGHKSQCSTSEKVHNEQCDKTEQEKCDKTVFMYKHAVYKCGGIVFFIGKKDFQIFRIPRI